MMTVVTPGPVSMEFALPMIVTNHSITGKVYRERIRRTYEKVFIARLYASQRMHNLKKILEANSHKVVFIYPDDNSAFLPPSPYSQPNHNSYPDTDRIADGLVAVVPPAIALPI